MDIVRSWIINIITVMMVSFFVEILMPSGSFKKYSKLVLGLIVMIMIIKPVVQLSDTEVLLNRMTIETGNYIDRVKIAEQSKILQEKQNQQIISAYQNKITEQIAQRVKAVSGKYDAQTKVSIDTNLDSSGFGSIRSIEVLLLHDANGEYISVVAPVRPVKVTTGSDDNLKQAQPLEHIEDVDNQQISEEEQQLKMKILDNLEAVYNVPRDNIKIHIQKNIK